MAFTGVMSACFAFALTAGNPIGGASLAAGTNRIWTGLPKLVVALPGGFSTNFVWCVLLNIKHKTGCQYLAAYAEPQHVGIAASGGDPGNGTSNIVRITNEALRVPRLRNYLFSALAGTT